MNYRSIGEAVRFYQERGYVYFDDVPWRVGRDAYYATKPAGAPDAIIEVPPDATYKDDRYLVASGEQSFIQMMLSGYSLKRAVCVTPCFRWESRTDTLRHDHFMKVELINAQDVDAGHLIDMICDARSFFQEAGLSVRVVATGPEAFDIVEKGSRFELGSYGIRRAVLPLRNLRHTGSLDEREVSWIYGTGVAEPRLETAKQKTLRNIGT